MPTEHLALSARGVRMEYRDRTSASGDQTLVALENVDLDVPDGSFVSLLGPSGCGKSTFLKIVNGLIRQTAGEIRVHRVAKGREDAMVFQDAALFPWYSALDNVAYGLVCAGVSRKEARKRAQPYIELVGLTGFEDRYPYQLSGGMQQRTGLARALAVEPEVLLMDEPFASIDAQTREILQFELLRIWESRPTSMVFVTHSIEEAVLMGDRVVILKGRPSGVSEIVDVGLAHPRSRATLGEKRFAEVREHVWSALMDEARRAEYEVAR
jgi:ABC-type nitrate/sulfonate/bicarbonate transport system ATPase subunit